jgi:small subunit ribosomal protein S6
LLFSKVLITFAAAKFISTECISTSLSNNMSDPMKSYEITFIVDPVLSGEEIKATAQTYVDLIKSEGYEIVHVDEMGLRQLAYAINKRTSGIYYCIEFKGETGEVLNKIELAMRRDERIMRFLTISLDKYGVKYNEDKRAGLIGKRKKKSDDKAKGGQNTNAKNAAPKKAAPKKVAPKKAAPVKAVADVAEEEE